jgi:ubiquinone/menaquinone biosynthesis C-methylase UbiE
MTTQLQRNDRTSSAVENGAPGNPAETYERYMVPVLFAPAAEHLLAVARLPPGERVLDVGTGTGIVARLAAPNVGPTGSVAGLDVSPAMLSVARAMAAEEGLSIDWREGQAEALPYPDRGFDLVLSQFALMFFADRQAALAEMRRVLVSGGRVAISVFQGIDRHPFYQALDEAIARRLGTSAVEQIFALGDGYALGASLEQAGFRDVVVEPFSIVARFPNPEAFLAGEIDVDTAAIPAMQDLDPTERRALTAAIAGEMAEPLREVTVGDRVQLTFHGHIARANR